MWLKDFIRGGLKLFRDRSLVGNVNSLSPKYKANQGCSVVQNQTTGEYVISDSGEEEGWFFNESSPTYPRGCGSWSLASPAVLDTDTNKVNLIKDKTLDSDLSYKDKTLSTTKEDTHNKVRVVESADNKVYGLIVACQNHESQEQLFFPVSSAIEKTILCYITSDSSSNGGVQPYKINSAGVAIITGTRVGDDSENPQTYYIALKFSSGQPGNPDGSEICHGEIIPIFMTQEFNEDDDTNWVAFVKKDSQNSALTIKDLGDGTGIIVNYINGSWVESGIAKELVLLGGSNFYGSPFRLDNIYLGTEYDNKFYVCRSGYDVLANEFAVNTVKLGVDFSGKVIYFEGL